MTKNELAKILEEHAMWLRDESTGLRADLRYADLRSADLSSADLRSANLRSANLRRADLSSADLSSADLRYADLSACKHLLCAADWLGANCDMDEHGVIVYKRFGKTEYEQPWKPSTGAVIAEVCNPLPTVDCGCGVNIGTRKWCDSNYTTAKLWKCRIRWIDLADTVVPYNTSGKFRCGRLECIEEVDGGDD